MFGFKFFLPFEKETKALLKSHNYRFDRVLPQSIDWNEAELRRIWRSRLAYFSDKKILDLAVICEDKQVDEEILALAQGSPRRMIIMGEFILLEYNRLPVTPRIIPKSCVEMGLKRFEETF